MNKIAAICSTMIKARPLYALALVLAAFPVRICCGEGTATGTAETQQLSAAGKSELLSIVASGRLEILNSPQFGEYKAQLGEFYSSGGYAMNWVRRSRAMRLKA